MASRFSTRAGVLWQDAQPGAEMLPADWQIHGMRMHAGESQPGV